MKTYTDNPSMSDNDWNNKYYPLLVAIAVMAGGPLSNICSLLLLSLFDAENPMAIPYVLIFR